ncbi:hypothetical protein SAMD00019534_085100 [Acytostelium subglobosum LB1]|uniref:hypothetical protein n=1 Tax=Acytostelium subglobosum LB1 TaxID=1410327 RepID=UPI000644C365|nr:hypothetical protein SAMD00019534_085100 [Acytostelium subglobosum LB1]GAM25335.1 hypothetical protein SAMD00019534_085100 [Acytostelium subglobosum LB1]|eukprot:XP_012751855.1 hypothetical protein SAMD00019534_085100 [Acytostelium subglobosum LB1]
MAGDKVPSCNFYYKGGLNTLAVSCDTNNNTISITLNCAVVNTNAQPNWVTDFPLLKSLSITLPYAALTVNATLTKHTNINNLELISASSIYTEVTDWTTMTSLQTIYIHNHVAKIPTLPTTLQNYKIDISPTSVATVDIQTSLFNPNLVSFHLDATKQPIATPASFTKDLITASTNLELFHLYTKGFSMDLTAFYNIPLVYDLQLIGVNPINPAIPKASDVNWDNLQTLTLSNMGLTGSFASLFSLPVLESLNLANNPVLTGELPYTIDETELRLLWLKNTSLSGTVPNTTLDGRIKNLDIRTTLLGGLLPTAFLCLPADATNPNTKGKMKYLFDAVFLNYNATYKETCNPQITGISPDPLSVNSSITILGNDIFIVDGAYSVTMNNTQNNIVNLNCASSSAGSITCTNGLIQGQGLIVMTIGGKVTSYNFTYQAPLITYATPCPTLGGWITLEGYDFMDVVGLQEGSGITVSGRKCQNIKIITDFNKVTCLFPKGIDSDLPFNFVVKGITSTEQSVNFFYNAPHVIGSVAIPSSVATQLSISGTDFWDDLSMINVTIGGSVNCPVTYVNHSIILCKFPSTEYVPGTMEIKVVVNGQRSPPNQLFQFVDEKICPNGCNNHGVCSVAIGYCVCEAGFAGPSCSQSTANSTYSTLTGSPMLTIVSSDNRTRLQAYLGSVIENGAETLSPELWTLNKTDAYTSVYSWSNRMEVVIRQNPVAGSDNLGGSANNFPAQSYTYELRYKNSMYVSSSLQFKMIVATVPLECDAPPMTLAYPSGSQPNQTQYLHWSLLTQYDTQWMSRYPQSGEINGIYGSVLTSVFAQEGSSQTLLINVFPTQGSGGSGAAAVRVTPSNTPINSANLVFDFAAYQATTSRAPGKTDCAIPDTTKSDNRWKIAVGVVVGVVGAALIGGLLFYIRSQHVKIEETKRLLDKKLAEINGHL